MSLPKLLLVNGWGVGIYGHTGFGILSDCCTGRKYYKGSGNSACYAADAFPPANAAGGRTAGETV